MWTEAHRARHDARLKEIVSLNAARAGGALAGACGPAAQRAGNALWGGRARDGLAPARRRGHGGRCPPALSHWRTAYGWFRRMAGAGPVRSSCCARLLGGAAVPWAAEPEPRLSDHRHPVGRVHPGAWSARL